MKKYEQKKAKELRRQGYSLNRIKDMLGVSKSSVSKWVKDIEIENEDGLLKTTQEKLLNYRDNEKKKHLELRKLYQKEGYDKATSLSNPLHIQGCMLYWAEGGKSRNRVDFTNSDVHMVKLFIRFLKECYSVKNEEISIYINCYINDNETTEKDIINYWLNQLKLPEICFKKITINNKPKSSNGTRKNKLKYGVCKIKVYNTRLVQNIFGAIKYYANIQDEKLWIN